MQISDRIVVRTPDGHSYSGRFLALRGDPDSPTALVRLDTGWETTFPLEMVHVVPEAEPRDSADHPLS